MKICPSCRYANEDDFNFCNSCRAKLPAAAWSNKKVIVVAIAISAVVVVVCLLSAVPLSQVAQHRRAERELERLASQPDPTRAPAAPSSSAPAAPIATPVETEIDPETMRSRMVSEWKTLVSSSNPHLNYISATVVKTKGGFALYAEHDFFSQYTMSAGDDAKVAEDFIATYRDNLKKAKITRVGYRGRGSYASWCYLEVP